MAGATWNCCHFGTSSVYIIQLCTSLQCHFIQKYIGMVHVCPLHIWQNDPWPVTWGWNGYRNKSQHRKLKLENKILSLLGTAETQTGTFQSWVGALTIEVSPLCWRESSHPQYEQAMFFNSHRRKCCSLSPSAEFVLFHGGRVCRHHWCRYCIIDNVAFAKKNPKAIKNWRLTAA